VNAKLVVDHKEKGKLKKGFCLNCWLKKEFCLCGKVPTFTIEKCNLLVFVHYKEYLRSSNTGILAAVACPQVQLFVSGRQEDEKKLAELITDNIHDTFALFPDDKAITITEFCEQRKLHYLKQQSGKDVCISDPKELIKKPVNVILLDATWRQAKGMRRRLPKEVPLVKLADNFQVSINTMRTQSTLGRISTVEAIAELLKALGEKQSEIDRLLEGLRLRMKAVHTMCNGDDPTDFLNEVKLSLEKYKVHTV